MPTHGAAMLTPRSSHHMTPRLTPRCGGGVSSMIATTPHGTHDADELKDMVPEGAHAPVRSRQYRGIY